VCNSSQLATTLCKQAMVRGIINGTGTVRRKLSPSPRQVQTPKRLCGTCRDCSPRCCSSSRPFGNFKAPTPIFCDLLFFQKYHVVICPTDEKRRWEMLPNVFHPRHMAFFIRVDTLCRTVLCLTNLTVGLKCGRFCSLRQLRVHHRQCECVRGVCDRQMAIIELGVYVISALILRSRRPV
jgi:hypothetical protein